MSQTVKIARVELARKNCERVNNFLLFQRFSKNLWFRNYWKIDSCAKTVIMSFSKPEN
jgi:hypothetical protein